MLTGRYVAGVCECFHENCMVESLTYRDVTGRERDVYVVCESHLKLQRPYVFFSQRLDRLIDVNYSFASIIGCAVFVRLIIDFCRKYSINRLIERLSGITIHEPVILLYFEYNLVAEKIVTMKVFCCFLIIRLLSAFFLHITDCDETYNYWEPLHYLTQGKGLQTWEYSPEYGLRSYFYLLLHAVPSFLLKTILDVDAIIAFYATRCMLAVICSVMETILFKVISQCFGNKIASWWLTFQLISPGLFISGTALLPSSFSMYLTMALHSAWWSKKIKLPIFLTVVSTFVAYMVSGPRVEIKDNEKHESAYLGCRQQELRMDQRWALRVCTYTVSSGNFCKCWKCCHLISLFSSLHDLEEHDHIRRKDFYFQCTLY
ncbi:uncharacterized protein LOC129775543 isoform X4 [Toxorhynchites rutilus septentrionalis]|uniref:uncharacterized protein LOC129775543 isoform X4 n=1 Tax=Toxorhynchites rutilus septentrionalis TaxID=329112 RepID=UPI002479C30E|nr:uncharacterized protein LOC129775543 isoform X4 [Toxorhynchites rutilus septentrionalis]